MSAARPAASAPAGLWEHLAAAPPAGPADVWATVARSIDGLQTPPVSADSAHPPLGSAGPCSTTDGSSATDEAPDVWETLADSLDLGAYVPTPSADVEVRAVAGHGGRRFWVLRSP